MRRTGGGFVAVVAVGVVAVISASGLASAAGSRIAGEESFVVYSQTAKYKAVDVGTAGQSTGDQDVFFDSLFDDTAKTHTVGADRVVVEYLPARYVMVQLEYTITGRGKLVAAGTLHFNKGFNEDGEDLAITGGTGDFESVKGSVHLSVFDNNTFQNDIHVLA